MWEVDFDHISSPIYMYNYVKESEELKWELLLPLNMEGNTMDEDRHVEQAKLQ